MKRKYLICAAMVAASVILFGISYFYAKDLFRNPFDRTLTFENPSYSVQDNSGSSYVIDRSMRRIVKVDAQGRVVYTIDGGSRSEKKFFYAYEIAVDGEGNLYLLNGVLDDEGFFMQREEILRYGPTGSFESVIYSKTYDDSEKKPELVQRGSFIALRADKEVVEWFEIDNNGIHPVRIIQNKGAIERLVGVDLPSANLLVSGAVRCADGSIVFSTKKGKIFKTAQGETPVELYSADEQKESLSIPWWVSADAENNIYFSDLGTKTIRRIDSDGTVRTVLSKDLIEKAGYQTSSFVYYRLNVSSNGALSTCNDYYLVTLSSDGSNIQRYVDGGQYSVRMVIHNVLLWIVFIGAIGLIAGAVIYLYRLILKSRIPLILKQLLIFVPMIIVSVGIPSKMIMDDYSKRYSAELNKKISLMVQVAPKALNPDDIQALSSHSSFLGDGYRRVRNSLLDAFNYNRDDWNRGFYFVLYHVKNDSLYGCMYLNGAIGVFYPFNYFDDPESIYRRAYKGETVSEEVSDVWGSWLYGVGPIYGKDGKVIALIEVGTDLYSYTQENKRLTMKMGMRICVVAVIFIIIIIAVTYILLVSIHRLRNGVNKLSRGEWDTKVKISNRRDEIADLAEGFNKMSEYILKYIRDIVNLNNGYHRFVPEQFLLYLGKDDVTQIQLGDQVQKVMTVMFSDIRSFTSLSETMTPKENFDFLNSYLRHMGPIIRGNNGFIDKYIGDAIMALFPFSADDALAAALGMYSNLSEFNAHRESKGYDPIAIGLGLHTGPLMLGVIGEEERMDGTVISDNVNFASRLEGLTKHYGALILISEMTYTSLKNPDKYLTRNLGKIRVKGKNEPVTVYEVLDPLVYDVKSMRIKTKDVFEKGILLYQGKRFSEALEKFNKVLAVDKNDKAVLVYQKITAAMIGRDISDSEWDGTVEMREK